MGSTIEASTTVGSTIVGGIIEVSTTVGGTIKYHNIPARPRIPEKDKKGQLSTSSSSSSLLGTCVFQNLKKKIGKTLIQKITFKQIFLVISVTNFGAKHNISILMAGSPTP